MNEVGVRRAQQEFVEDNAADLVLNITHSGTARGVDLIRVTRFTPPVSPYHINISCTGARVRNIATANASYQIIGASTYAVAIELADYIYSELDEETLFETMVMDFLTVRDRLANALLDIARLTGRLVNEDGDIFKFDVAVNEAISVQNIEEFVVDTVPVMYSAIRFTLKDC